MGRLAAHEGAVTALAFTPDGKTLVSGGGSAVHFWDVATGRGLRKLEPGGKVARGLAPVWEDEAL